MKHVVVQGRLRESEIHPRDLFSRFRELSIRDARALSSDPAGLVSTACPACDSSASAEAFERHGFAFRQCEECQSVFVSPRPRAEALARHYRESEAIRFRGSQLGQEAGEARRVSLLRANSLWLGQMTDEAGLDRPRAYCDLGTNYPLLFAEIGKLGVFDSMFSCSPVPGLEDSCARYGAQVVAAPPDGLAAASAFEQLEHVFSPLDYLRGIHRALAGGGLLFLTTRTISGFDLQMLWGHSPYIYAPEHLNLLSVEGIARLLERAGFEMHELSTPGQLDVELAKAAAEGDPAIPIPPFFRYVLSRRGRETLEDWQAFLQKHRLSSHARLAAVKRPSHAGACLAR